ncbi:hypothetical protein [Streptomyces sp. NPDC002067]
MSSVEDVQRWGFGVPVQRDGDRWALAPCVADDRSAAAGELTHDLAAPEERRGGPAAPHVDELCALAAVVGVLR